MDAQTGSAIAGGIQAVGGLVTTLAAAKQQFDAIERMTKAAEKEMEAISIQGEEAARTAIQRAYAALRDSAFLDEMTEANIRHITEQENAAIGTVIAQTAGSGLDFVGSPVLVAANISLQANRVIQNQLITQKLGQQQFEFEVDKELRNAGLARQSAEIAIEATAISRGAQIGAAQFDAFKSLVTAGNQVTSILDKYNRGQTVLNKQEL